MAVALRLALALTLFFAATAGGRITASDEYTMYRLTEALVTKGQVSVEAGNAEKGPDGRLYPKAALGQGARRRSVLSARPTPRCRSTARARNSLRAPSRRRS
jgi:hypothetical protein